VGLWQIIEKSTLSVDEVEKVKAVKLIEADKLNLNSYKVIKSIQGLSCEIYKSKMSIDKMRWKVVEKPSRKKGIEQLKIHAVRAGGNAIINVVCLLKNQSGASGHRCLKYIQCTADVLQVD